MSIIHAVGGPPCGSAWAERRMHMEDDSAIQNEEAVFQGDSDDEYEYPSRRADDDDSQCVSDLRRIEVNEAAASAREKKEAVSIWQHELDTFRGSIERENAHLCHTKTDA